MIKFLAIKKKDGLLFITSLYILNKINVNYLEYFYLILNQLDYKPLEGGEYFSCVFDLLLPV